MTRNTSAAKRFRPRHTAPPKESARNVALASARRTVSPSPSAHARATMPVVVMERNENSWNTIWNTAVFGPSAARLVLPCRPTAAVSMRLISGSARSEPSAGIARDVTSRSSSRPNTPNSESVEFFFSRCSFRGYRIRIVFASSKPRTAPPRRGRGRDASRKTTRRARRRDRQERL